MSKSCRIQAPFLAMVLLVPSAVRAAGSLQPPGPPDDPSTLMKTLDEMEPRIIIDSLPFDIKTPGSYYLVNSLTGKSGDHGIIIASDDVKLDLNGYSLNGVRTALNGIYVYKNRHNITIRNGVIRGWGGIGINASNAQESVFVSVNVFTNTAGGMLVGENALLADCGAHKNNAEGIVAGSAGTIRNCNVRGNRKTGIKTAPACQITDCTVENNMDGIVILPHCTVRGCTVISNLRDGIYVNDNSRVNDNHCSSNGLDKNDGAGIHVVGSYNRIQDNTLTGNYVGLLLDTQASANLVVRNTAGGNIGSDYERGTLRNFFAKIPKDIGLDFDITNPWANFQLE